MYDYDYLDILAHHGVKGMKWGHRKSKAEIKAERKEYKADMRTRRDLEREAYVSGRWAKAYTKTSKQVDARTLKRAESDMRKTGNTSNKTNRKIIANELLKQDTKYVTNKNREAVKALEQHVDKMIDKYADRSIKTMSYSEKDGERFVATRLAAMADANATYSVRNINGRYVGVKTRYY